jgi:hypothetical protein
MSLLGSGKAFKSQAIHFKVELEDAFAVATAF